VRRGLVGLAVVCAALGGVLILDRATPEERRTSPDASAVDVSPEAAEAVAVGPEDATRPDGRSRATGARTAAPASSQPLGSTSSELGTIRIETDTPGASVFIDRQFIGRAPVTTANIRPGTYQLSVSADGFDTVTRTIDVEPGPREIMVRLKAEP
jgi:hypothetical protein